MKRACAFDMLILTYDNEFYARCIYSESTKIVFVLSKMLPLSQFEPLSNQRFIIFSRILEKHAKFQLTNVFQIL